MGRGLRLRRLGGLLLWVALACAAVFGVSALISAGLDRAAAALTDDLNLQYRIRLPFNIILSFVRSALRPSPPMPTSARSTMPKRRAAASPFPGRRCRG